MADFIAMDAAYTAKQIEHMIAAYPELADDQDLLHDAIEGETQFFDLMSKLVRLRNERIADINSLSDYIGDLSERKARKTRGNEGLKALMQTLMDAAGMDKVALPEATISKTKARESVVIVDVEALPQGYVTYEPKPNKTAIKAALDAGDDIPGARLEMGEPSLTIRIK